MKIRYDHKTRDKHWQNVWAEGKLYEAETVSNKPKYYALIEFPYPSGEGLHVGHPRPYIGLDIIARKRRAEGFNVLYPIGWDAFGLPTENFAIKTGIHPMEVTKKNTDTFRKQIKSLGISFDWSREINTTDPSYYKWTQWIFLKMFEKGLAYKSKIAVNWCISCKIGLANEEVIGGKCERCGGETEKREKEQWLLAITKYAERLLSGLDTVNYFPEIKIQQRNWIGKSEGAEIQFPISNFQFPIKVFTTRPDTLFGATYLVISPEHQILENLNPSADGQISNFKQVKEYVELAKKKSEIERTAEGREKTGVKLEGIKAINPGTNEEIPIFVADYVIAHYGTGAIMAVPAHDERDFEFSKKFKLPIIPVIAPSEANPSRENILKGKECYEGEGTLVNSGEYNSLDSEEARKKITEKFGETKVTYKLRDWVFSRQRYWGEPIPLVFCVNCAKQVTSYKLKVKSKGEKFNEGEILNPGWAAVSESELPITLPEISSYKPTDTGESPLSGIPEWVETTCPKCGGAARRETDVMPNWAGSSWYFLRYTDPKNDRELASRECLEHWMPVDWYNGGMEHTTLHLLYSRFWNYFLYDIGIVPVEEPYAKRTSHGLILAEGGAKMSKSKGNVINPDDIVSKFGADTFRLYEMFIGPFREAISWNSSDIAGVERFLDRVFDFASSVVKEKGAEKSDKSIVKLLHQTIVKVSRDIEEMSFNTAISQLMICLNEIRKHSNKEQVSITRSDLGIFLKLLSPFAPHLTEELWRLLGNTTSIHREQWPTADTEMLKAENVTIVVQINGRVRGEIIIAAESEEKDALEALKKEEKINHWLSGKNISKIIFVRNRLINILVD